MSLDITLATDQPTGGSPSRPVADSHGLSWSSQRSLARRWAERQLGHSLGARVDPSDVAQEVLLRVLEQAQRRIGPPRIDWIARLKRALRDRMIELRRFHLDATRRSLKLEQPLGANLHLSDPATPPPQRCERHEDHAAVLRALRALSPNDQLVIQRVLIEEYSLTDLARELDLSHDAARKRVGRAVRRLTRQLHLQSREAWTIP